MNRLVSLLLFIWSLYGANTYAEIKDITLGLGLIDENVRTYQTNTAGDRNFADFRVLIETQMYYDIFEDSLWFFIPSAGLQFPQSTEESSVKKTRFHFNAHVGRQFDLLPDISLMFRLGTGLYLTYFSSDGGTTTLPNGNSTTEFFLLPESSWSRNLTTNAAFEFKYLDYSLKNEFFIFNLTNSEKRALTYSLTLNYHFKDLI